MNEERFSGFNKAIRRNPDDPHPLIRRAVAWLDANERERAMQDLDAALALEPRPHGRPWPPGC